MQCTAADDGTGLVQSALLLWALPDTKQERVYHVRARRLVSYARRVIFVLRSS